MKCSVNIDDVRTVSCLTQTALHLLNHGKKEEAIECLSYSSKVCDRFMLSACNQEDKDARKRKFAEVKLWAAFAALCFLAFVCVM